ncbi:hypothetical protein Nmel_017075 [Mimus melanotis]
MHSGSPNSREKLGLGFNECFFTHWEQQGIPVMILHCTRTWKKAESSSTFLFNRNCALMKFSLMKADLGFSFCISGFHVTAQLSDSLELKGQFCSHPCAQALTTLEQPGFWEPG